MPVRSGSALWGARLLGCCALLGACASEPRNYYGVTRPKHGPDEFWYNLGTDPEFLDPGLATDSVSGTVVSNLFAGLTQPHPKTLTPMPNVARGWSVSDGGRRYVFHLRPTRWSDGTPVTAHDFVFAFRRVLDPVTASRYATLLYPFRYAEQVHQRALWVGDLPPQADEATLRAWAEAVFAVRRIVLAPERRGAFVEPEDPADLPARTALAAKLTARPLLGLTRPVRVATGEDLAVRALSDLRLEIRLVDPIPYLLSILAFYTAMPVPRHLFERLDAEGVPLMKWTRPEHIVVNGPYLLSEWAFRRRIVLDKNPRYWDADSVRMPRVKLTMVESYNTTLNLYKAGEIDHIGAAALPAEFLDHLAQFEDFRSEKQLSVYLLWLNTQVPPLDDPRVRQALSLAIDRARLVRYVTRGGQAPTADLVPDGLADYRGLGRPLFDPQRARALLEEAGYGPSRPLPPVVYTYNTTEAHKQVAEAIQQMWKAHLGIDVRIENQEWRVFLKNLQARSFQVGRLGWVADYPDPYTFLDLLLSGNENNHAGWANPAYDRLLRRANAAADPEARLALLREAEALALAEQPLIPVYVYTRPELVKPYVRGAYLNYQRRVQFKYVSIDERFYRPAPKALPEVLPPVRLPSIPDAGPPDGGPDAAAGGAAREDR